MTQHVCSKKDAASFFRVSVQALDGWFTAGCPVLERGDGGRIKSVCLEDMTEWRIARISEDASGTLEAERIRLTKAQADKAELDVAETRGEIARMPLIEAYWAGLVSAFRARMLSLPSRCAARIAAPDKLVEVTEILQGAIYEGLAELAGDGIPNEIRDRIAAQGLATDDADSAPTAEPDAESVGEGEADTE